MKTGKTLSELAREIERQQESKRDFVAPTAKVDFDAGDGVTPALVIQGERFPINANAAGQIAQHTGIPKAYFDRMAAEQPKLLADNVIAWFRHAPANRMVRTLDGRARAFLSDRYRPLEHADFAQAILPALMEQELEVMSCEITERRLYIKAVDRRIHRDVPTGRKLGDGSHVFFDTLSPAIIISNSEVGAGRLSIDYGVYTKVCTNLAMIAGEGMKKTHLGARLDVAENFERMLTDETKEATDRAIWMQARDVVKAAFDEMRFTATTDKIAGLVSDVIEGDPVKVVELATKRLGMSQDEGKGVLRHLIEGGELSRYGLFNAVTRAAQDTPDYDRATDFEAMGGKIIELPRSEWRELARAA